MERITQLFKEKKNNILSIFFTAGFPKLNDTSKIILELNKNKVDFIEVGLPYSDPLADGKTIQHSSEIALQNGMNLDVLFEQLQTVKNINTSPLILMGYLNQIVKYGEDTFFKKCKNCGVKTVIIPDLPIIEYENYYQKIFKKYGISNVFLITPDTSEKRIKKIDTLTHDFIYVVASRSITGTKDTISQYQIDYFKRLKAMNLKSNLIIGFGISNKITFKTACQYANGAIIGSAFIKYLNKNGVKEISKFIKQF